SLKLLGFSRRQPEADRPGDELATSDMRLPGAVCSLAARVNRGIRTCDQGDRFRCPSGEKLRLHRGRRMNAYQLRPPSTDVGEAVRHVRRADHYVARTALNSFVADLHSDVAFKNYEGLVVRVKMQLGPLPWVVVHEEERHRRRAINAALESAGY